MRVILGGDHAGFELKNTLKEYLKSLGHEISDLGPFEYNDKDDYPDFVSLVAKQVSENPEFIKGIVIGGSGQGEAMCANRFSRVRAVVYYGAPGVKDRPSGSKRQIIIKLSREHNDANVLSLGARFITEEEAKEVVKLWLETPYSGDERHTRRILKIDHSN